MSFDDIRCQERYWYTCFWNQHGISDHLSLLWVKSENIVKIIFFSSKGPPFGFGPFFNHLSEGFLAEGGPKLKDKDLYFSPNIIILWASHPTKRGEWFLKIIVICHQMHLNMEHFNISWFRGVLDEHTYMLSRTRLQRGKFIDISFIWFI